MRDQALDENIRKAFKLPLPRYDSFGFDESEAGEIPKFSRVRFQLIS